MAVPGDHGALLYLFLHLKPVKQAWRWSLNSQRRDVNLDQGGGWDSDHPDTQHVRGVGARVVWRAETSL